MTKKHFIALANLVKQTRPSGEGNPVAEADSHYIGERGQWEYMREQLADFCTEQNPRFNRERWLDYIDGKCGPNGGAVNTRKIKDGNLTYVGNGMWTSDSPTRPPEQGVHLNQLRTKAYAQRDREAGVHKAEISPLPWEHNRTRPFTNYKGERENGYACAIYSGDTPICTTNFSVGKYKAAPEAIQDANAAYIVKAANEYPKLQDLIGTIEADDDGKLSRYQWRKLALSRYDDVERMRAQRDELLAALKNLCDMGFNTVTSREANAAIAKCEASK